MTPTDIRAGLFVLIAAVISGATASAQEYSPFLEATGQGPYDLYRDTLLCNAVLEGAIEAEPEADRRPQLEQGVTYTAGFAGFLLTTGNVVGAGGEVLSAAALPTNRLDAHAEWQAILLSLNDGGEAAEAEIDRCLRLYGHEWE
jgi:hypothetical protein